MSDLKSRIEAAEDIPFEDLEVPEWGAEIRVRGLTGTERDGWEAKMVALRRQGQDIELRAQNFRSRLLVRCLRDPDTDDRIFTDDEVNVLGAKSGIVIERLFNIARRLSGLDEDAITRAEGNSGSGPSDGSTSD